MGYRILAVAPYEALKKMLEGIAEGMKDVQLDCRVGDMEEGARIVQEAPKGQYDAIISRGGTARCIEKVTTIPVIDIVPSVYDILRAIRLADNYRESYAVVGFRNITEPAHLLCDLLGRRLRIITIRDGEESAIALSQLKSQGIRTVVCDNITQQLAREQEINAILITSGVESAMEAMNQAVRICRSYSTICEENRFLRAILENGGSSTIVYSEDGDMFLSTWKGDSGEEEAKELMKRELPGILRNGDQKFFRTIGHTLYSVETRTSEYNSKRYVLFYITASKIPLSRGRYGIQFFSCEEVEKRYYESFYSTSGVLGIYADRMKELAQAGRPIMIESEEGTGRDTIAGYIYARSELKSHPLIFINCPLLDDRGWEYLLNHYNSPFNDNDNTIYLSGIDRISEDRHKRLLSLIIDSNLHRRNQLIFSSDQNMPPDVRRRVNDYTTKLLCAKIGLPPLRERREEIPLIANLYLSKLNQDLGRQIIGLEPRAEEMLEDYSWPQNYRQLQRVLMESAMHTETNTAYIRADTVAMILQQEKASNVYRDLFSSSAREKLPDLTLEEIDRQIIQKALEDNKGNQSRTAKQLGISRTTLWRYLGRGKNTESFQNET
ncbi:MAG: PrpR N-terminal domain-containing protein [Lachnospiraceae bacterium]